jgi:uracil-DNA glycosylase family 4
VGDAPTLQDDRRGRPFSAQTGQYLRTILDRSGYDVVYTYGLRCPQSVKKITKGHYDGCRPYLAQTIDDAVPQRILCFGAIAIQAVLGKGYPTMDVRRGYAFTEDGTPVFFLMPPGVALRNRVIRGQLEADLEWALRVDLDTLMRPPEHGAVMLITEPEDVQTAIGDLEISEAITLDLETFGRPGNREFQVLNMALTPADSDLAYVWDAEAFSRPELREPVLNFLEGTRVPVGGANAKYDLGCLLTVHGRRILTGFDTQLWRKLLTADVAGRLAYAQTSVGMSGGKDEAKEFVTAGNKELNALADRKPKAQVKLFNLPAEQLQIALDRIRLGEEPAAFSYAAIPPDVRSRYNTSDTISSDRLRRQYGRQMRERPNIQAVWDKITRPLSDAIIQMEFNGVAVDRAKIMELQTVMLTRVEESLAILKGYDSAVNWNHAPSILPVMRRITGRNLPSTDKGALSKINHPAVTNLIAYRRASKFKSTYADGMLGFICDDERVHASFKIDGTESGRPSGEQPNLLNIPKPKTADGKMCRDVFIAPDLPGEPERMLVELDFSQIELRVAAMLSQDSVMIETFKAGVDFHLATAIMIAHMFGVDPASVDASHWLRDAAKTVNFGTLYGEPAAGLAAKLGITREQGEKLQDAILGKFKILRAWLQTRLQFTRKHGYAPTWWDGIMPFRERPLPDIADSNEELRATAERSSWNTPIQGTAADFMNASLGRVHQAILSGEMPKRTKLILTVYDSMILECDASDVNVVARGARDIMQGWNSMGVPIIADCKVGKSWGSLKEYHVQ